MEVGDVEPLVDQSYEMEDSDEDSVVAEEVIDDTKEFGKGDSTDKEVVEMPVRSSSRRCLVLGSRDGPPRGMRSRRTTRLTAGGTSGRRTMRGGGGSWRPGRGYWRLRRQR